MKYILLILFFSAGHNLIGKNIDVSFITRLEGDVRILSFPKRRAIGPGPHVKFNNKYYRYKQARLGDEVRLGSVVQSGPKSKVRLVFENGDYVTLSEGSSFIMKRIREKSNIEVFYGRLRTVVKKGGELSDLTVKTRSMAMGVRGTDFLVEAFGDKSRLSVLRGSVSVSPSNNPELENLVGKGYSAFIDGLELSDEDIVKIKRLEKGEIMAINTHTSIKFNRRDSQQGMLALTEDPVSAKIRRLEKKALENTLTDVKDDDSELYKNIKKNNIKDLDILQKKIGNELIKE